MRTLQNIRGDLDGIKKRNKHSIIYRYLPYKKKKSLKSYPLTLWIFGQ